MSKMRYFSNKFSKTPSAGDSPPPAPINLQFWETRHETNVTRYFHFGPLPIKISGYANVLEGYADYADGGGGAIPDPFRGMGV